MKNKKKTKSVKIGEHVCQTKCALAFRAGYLSTAKFGMLAKSINRSELSNIAASAPSCPYFVETLDHSFASVITQDHTLYFYPGDIVELFAVINEDEEVLEYNVEFQEQSFYDKKDDLSVLIDKLRALDSQREEIYRKILESL